MSSFIFTVGDSEAQGCLNQRPYIGRDGLVLIEAFPSEKLMFFNGKSRIDLFASRIIGLVHSVASWFLYTSSYTVWQGLKE